jgi:hypothetical protein
MSRAASRRGAAHRTGMVKMEESLGCLEASEVEACFVLHSTTFKHVSTVPVCVHACFDLSVMNRAANICKCYYTIPSTEKPYL